MTPSQSICCIILSFNIIRDTINNKDMRTTWYNSKVLTWAIFKRFEPMMKCTKTYFVSRYMYRKY